ncbi:hypothetical protein GCM10009733_080530 [Nonomuraea maheshkhaliensis]|uniref:Uncharacterized protein n=1 Tax=Nonomuraea maheshkhaliensis TaxID=419590 RepID=A0ABN2GGV5_9ACTN
MTFSAFGLTNTVWAVILPSLLNPFGVYLMHVYARDAVPDDVPYRCSRTSARAFLSGVPVFS